MVFKKRIFLTYFYILLIPITILFVILYSYVYSKQRNDFNAENMITVSLIANSIDDLLSSANASAIQISSTAAMSNILTKKTSNQLLDYNNIFNDIHNNINNNPLINSIYVYFTENSQVLTNYTFYNLTDFFEKDLIKRISQTPNNSIWFDYRKIPSGDLTYINSKNVISIIRGFPLMDSNPKIYVIVNLDENLLLQAISKYKHASLVSIAVEDTVIADFDETLIDKRLSDIYRDVDFSSNSGTGKNNGEYLYFKNSSISNFKYILRINENVLKNLQLPFQYVMFLMYLTGVMTLLIFSYIYAKTSKNNLGYLIKKITGQLSENDLKKDIPDEFSLLTKAIDTIVIDKKILEEKIQSYKDVVKDMLIYDIISGETNSLDEIDTRLSYTSMAFQYPNFTAFVGMIVDYDNNEDLRNDSFNYSLKLYIKDIIRNKLSKDLISYSCLLDNDKIGFFINHNLAHNEIIVQLSSLLQQINLYIQDRLDIYLLFSIGNTVGNIGDVAKSSFNAKKFINSKVSNDKNLIITDKAEINDMPVFPIALKSKLVNSFKINSSDSIKQVVEIFFDEYLRANHFSLEMSKNISTILVFGTLKELWENDLVVPVEDSLEISNLIIEKNSFTALHQYLTEFFLGLLDEQYTQTIINKEDSAKYITEVIHFINNNYHKDLSISEIATCVELNPRYLGVIFKEATGKTLVKYLNAVRIKKAKQLLVEGKKSIKEISFEVGYNDIHAFIRHFKGIANVTPSEYRELIKNKEITN